MNLLPFQKYLPTIQESFTFPKVFAKDPRIFCHIVNVNFVSVFGVHLFDVVVVSVAAVVVALVVVIVVVIGASVSVLVLVSVDVLLVVAVVVVVVAVVVIVDVFVIVVVVVVVVVVTVEFFKVVFTLPHCIAHKKNHITFMKILSQFPYNNLPW